MYAVASEIRLWDIIRPMLLAIAAALLGFAILEYVTGAEPMPQKDPAPVSIVSPWNGAFYAREYEGGKPFVEVGSKVSPHTTVCIIEGPRQFRIPAGVDGTIIEVVAKEQQIVHPGQTLFKVQPVRLSKDPPR